MTSESDEIKAEVPMEQEPGLSLEAEEKLLEIIAGSDVPKTSEPEEIKRALGTEHSKLDDTEEPFVASTGDNMVKEFKDVSPPAPKTAISVEDLSPNQNIIVDNPAKNNQNDIGISVIEEITVASLGVPDINGKAEQTLCEIKTEVPLDEKEELSMEVEKVKLLEIIGESNVPKISEPEVIKPEFGIELSQKCDDFEEPFAPIKGDNVDKEFKDVSPLAPETAISVEDLSPNQIVIVDIPAKENENDIIISVIEEITDASLGVPDIKEKAEEILVSEEKTELRAETSEKMKRSSVPAAANPVEIPILDTILMVDLKGNVVDVVDKEETVNREDGTPILDVKEPVAVGISPEVVESPEIRDEKVVQDPTTSEAADIKSELGIEISKLVDIEEPLVPVTEDKTEGKESSLVPPITEIAVKDLSREEQIVMEEPHVEVSEKMMKPSMDAEKVHIMENCDEVPILKTVCMDDLQSIVVETIVNENAVINELDMQIVNIKKADDVQICHEILESVDFKKAGGTLISLETLERLEKMEEMLLRLLTALAPELLQDNKLPHL